MLIKCESKSSRVKGISFHPRLAWVLVSLHNGVIQLWDFRLGCLLEKFEEHDGPVRGVDFHSTQPIFVSGGDDYRVKLWNHKQKKSLFTLYGHLDYIRTVQFHTVNPWIVSASDDQTVRIWNWQNRHCLSVLAGHCHYVMCARFHLNEDLLVSASLDQTIRIWDISGLKEKSGNRSKSGSVSGMMSSGMGGGGGLAFGGPGGANEIFGTSDAVCKFILEGHERGVNYATFHPTLQLVVSGADDRMVKIWRYDDTKWWEVDTLRGHFNNVSCVMFHPQRDLIISNSEDRSIRVWDMTKRTLIHTYRRDSDRFWVLAGLPNSNLMAVGHDTGMVVFKLEKERPPNSTVLNDKLSLTFLVKDNWIYCHFDIQHRVLPSALSDVIKSNNSGNDTAVGDSNTLPNTRVLPPNTMTNHVTNSRYTHTVANVLVNEVAVTACRRLPNALVSGPHHISVNPLNSTETDIMVFYTDSDSYSLDIITISEDWKRLAALSGGSIQLNQAGITTRTQKSNVVSAVFCARNRYACLDATGTVTINYYNGDICKRIDLKERVDALFYSGNNRLLIKPADASILLYDISTRKVMADLDLSHIGTSSSNSKIKYAIWSPNMKYLALLSRHCIVLTNSKLEYLSSTQESIRVKSGAWDEFDSFIFNTVSHVKYMLLNGETGLLHSIPGTAVIYIIGAADGCVSCIDKDAKLRRFTLDLTEYYFKIALQQKRFDQVAAIIRNGNLKGNALVNYLTNTGYPEIAINVVGDIHTKLLLGLNSGDTVGTQNLLTTLEADGMKVGDGWKALSDLSLNCGQFEIAEKAVQRSRDFVSLMFMYLITGQFHKMKMVGDLAHKRNDMSTAFHTALVCGNVEDRITYLRTCACESLAYALAYVHGTPEDQIEVDPAVLDSKGQESIREYCKNKNAEPYLFFPPQPLFKPKSNYNWPEVPLSMMPSASKSPRERLSKEMFEHLIESIEPKPFNQAQVHAALLGSGGIDPYKAKPAAVAHVSPPPADSDTDEPAMWDVNDDDIFEGVLSKAKSTDDAVDEVAQSTHVSTDSERYDPIVGSNLTRGPCAWRRLLADGGSQTCAYLVAAGEFEIAFSLLKRRIGLTDATKLVPLFERAYQAANVYLLGMPGMIPWNIPVPSPEENSSPIYLYYSVNSISSQYTRALDLFTKRKFADSLNEFRYLIRSATLVVAQDLTAEKKIHEVMAASLQYVLAIRMELERQSDNISVSRMLTMVVMETLCALKPGHKYYTIREAIKHCRKHNNFITASKLIRRLIDSDLFSKIPEAEGDLEKFKQLLLLCEKQTNEEVPLEGGSELLAYVSNERDILVIDADSLTAVPKSSIGSVINCPLCKASYLNTQVCKVCEVCRVDSTPVLGLSYRVLNAGGARQ